MGDARAPDTLAWSHDCPELERTVSGVLVVGFPAPAFATNCYVVAPGAGEECLVVDPGVGVAGTLEDIFRQHRLRPVAALLTHGHLDHVFSVVPVCGARGIPAYLHPDDRAMLRDPLRWMPPETAMAAGSALPWTEPDDVRMLHDAEVVHLAGLSVSVDHAPGHTRGSVMFRLPRGDFARDSDTAPDAELCVSGDVLFAGSIGRTDLPSGSHPQMLHTLAHKVLPLRDDTLVLPGHGPATTIGRERVTNPYLRNLAPARAG
jgi:hydroxyacylglutathione hydrolase